MKAVKISRLSNGIIPLCDLPEGCIANILSLTSPRDACRLSLVAPVFRSAAESDEVWKRFLPPDYSDIPGRSVEWVELLGSPMPRKELFLHLCDHPILIDGGMKSFSLEKSSGKKCYMLSARDMTMKWSNNPSCYWRLITQPDSSPKSRFSSVAELILARWLKIRGTIKTSMLSPRTTYAAYLVFIMNLAAFGIEQPAAEASVGLSGQEGQEKAVHLVPYGEGQQETDVQQRGDGWMEVELGEIFINGGEDGNLEISLLEIKEGHWKSGLVIEGIEIRPKKGK